MIPTTEITGGILDALIVYVAILGILLLFATWLRLKIPFLKKYHIPAALVAGIIGLILGPHFIGLIPSHITACWSALSGRLIVFVFAPMLMGGSSEKVGKGIAKRLGGTCCFRWALTAAQYALPMGRTAVITFLSWIAIGVVLFFLNRTERNAAPSKNE